KEKDEWFFTGDLAAYLKEEVGKQDMLPAEPITAKNGEKVNSVDYALVWTPNAERAMGESYVNLIPTAEGGTHVNGLRAGIAGAVREFCEFRNLVPRGLKLSPEDIFDKCCFVLSIKIQEPQFAGQMKERLASRDAASLVEGFVHDSLSLWLNQHPDAGERIAQFAIENAQERTKCTTSRWPWASIRARVTCPGCVITRSASSRTRTRTVCTLPRCCARCSCGTSGRWSPMATCSSPCRRCIASMRARMSTTHS